MSFLSRDALDGPGDLVRPATGVFLGGGRPGSAAGGRSPTGDPSMSLLGAPDAGGGDEVRTPSSQVNMREKMMQQKQRQMMAAKQRMGGGGPMVGMVQANQSAPPAISTPTNSNSRPGTATNAAGGPGSLIANSSPMGLGSSSFAGTSDIDRERKRHEDDDEGDKGTLIQPAMTPAMKEEETRRRTSLSQELNDRGICPEYDPLDGAAPDNRCNLDVASIMPHEMRGFIHNPLPKTAGMLQCRIVRDKTGIANRLSPKYILESDAGVFIMCGQKQVQNKTPNYALSMSKGQLGKGTDAFLGKLRSDVCGLQWTAYGPGLNPTKVDGKSKEVPAIQLVRDELCGVQYSASFWGSKPKGPRKITVTLPHVQPNGERLVCRTLNPANDGLVALAAAQSQLIESFTNKSPKWNDTIGAYVLNFNKRVTEASVKNFQLVNSTDPDTVYLQFGKVGKDAFNLDFRHPVSPFQAFTICLTAFEYKLGCE